VTLGEKEMGKQRGYQAGLVVCVVLIVVLGSAYVSANQNFTSQINSLNADKANLQNQVNSLTFNKTKLQNQVDSLQSQINLYSAWLSGNVTLLGKYKTWLNGNVTKYESQIASLQAQINALKAAKLILVNLQSEDVNRPWVGGSYLHVYGEVCNVGTNIAYNCRLHVVAYQSGGVIAIDTYIVLGVINGESWVTVEAKIYYTGSALTSWTITPEWTS